jgi:hypothetical protein
VCVCIHTHTHTHTYTHTYTYDADLRDAGVSEQYWTCIYWAVSTVSTIGYGDVRPVNHVERQYVLFVVVAGVLSFSFAMGIISSLMGKR